MQMPADQTKHIYVSADLSSTYGGVISLTTPLEEGRVLERDATNRGNITGYAAYTSREQGISLAQRLSTCVRYTSPTEFTTTETQDQGLESSRPSAAEHGFWLARL